MLVVPSKDTVLPALLFNRCVDSNSLAKVTFRVIGNPEGFDTINTNPLCDLSESKFKVI